MAAYPGFILSWSTAALPPFGRIAYYCSKLTADGIILVEFQGGLYGCFGNFSQASVKLRLTFDFREGEKYYSSRLEMVPLFDLLEIT